MSTLPYLPMCIIILYHPHIWDIVTFKTRVFCLLSQNSDLTEQHLRNEPRARQELHRHFCDCNDFLDEPQHLNTTSILRGLQSSRCARFRRTHFLFAQKRRYNKRCRCIIKKRNPEGTLLRQERGAITIFYCFPRCRNLAVLQKLVKEIRILFFQHLNHDRVIGHAVLTS